MKFLSAMVQRLGFALALALSIFAGAARAQDKADTTTMIVVDMSGSMLQFMGSLRRYEIAQTMLADVLPDVTEQSNTGLVAFGHRRENDCTDIELFAQPGAPLDRLRGYVSTLTPVNRAKTPLRDAVALAANQIPIGGQGTIVVVSDGEDNCGVNVCDLVPTLQSRGIPVFMMGISLESESIEQIQCLTTDTGGFLIQTESAAELPRYTDFLFRLSRLRTQNASLTEEIGGVRAILADQALVQADMQNQILILTQRLADADRSDEITALQAEIARLRGANDDKQGRITGLESSLLMMEQQQASLTAERDGLKAEISRLKALITELQTRLNEALSNQRDAGEINALQAEITRLRTLVDRFSADLINAQTTANRLQRQTDEQSSENSQLVEERARLLLQIETLTRAETSLAADNEARRAEIARLEGMLAEQSDSLARLQAQAAQAGAKDEQIARLLARVTELEAQEGSLQEQVRTMTETVARKDRMIEGRNSTIAQVRRTIERLNGLLARKNALIASLREEILGLESRLDALDSKSAEIDDLKAVVASLQADLASGATRIDSLNEQLDTARATAADFKDQATADREEISRLILRLEIMRAASTALTDIIGQRDRSLAALLEQLGQAQRAAAEAENTVLRLRDEAAALGQERDSLQQQIIILEGQRSDWLSDRDSLQAERDAAVSARDAAEQSVAPLRTQLGTLEGERDSLNALVDQMQGRLEAAVAESSDLRTDNDALRNRVIALEAEVKDRTAVIDDLMAQLKTASEERDSLLSANDVLNRTHASLRAVIDERDTEIADLRLDLRALRTTLDEARMALGDERIRVQRLFNQLEATRRSFLGLLSACHSEADMAAFADARIEDLGAAAGACIGDYSAVRAERDDLLAALDGMTLDRDDLRQQLDAQDPTYALVTSRLGAVEAENERLLALLNSQNPSYDLVVEQLETVTAERDRLISLLDSQDPSYLVLKSQVEGLTAERERLALLLSAQEPSYQTLRDRLETTSIERDRLTALLAEQSPSYEVLEAQLEEVILRLERCETARGTLSEELARLQGVVRENNAFIDGQRAQLDAQEVYIARLITGGITAAEIEAYCQTR